MKNKIRTWAYIFASFYAYFSYVTTYALNFGQDKVSDSLKWVENNDLVEVVTNIVWYIIGLLYLIALVYGLYGWFLVLTSAGEEDKMKKWRDIIVYMVAWLILIFLASTLVNWVINVISSDRISW